MNAWLTWSIRTRAGGAAMVVALAGGCGGGDDAGGYESPLADLLGWSGSQSTAERRATDLEIQEAIVTCMSAEGFEYEPVDHMASFPDVGEDELSRFDDPEAYGEKYGYGMVRNYELYEEPWIGEDGGFMDGGFEDPNDEYVRSLSESEREAYHAMLHGEISMAEEEFTDGEEAFYVPPLEEQGCYGKAQLEVVGEDPLDTNPEIMRRLDDFYQDLENDPDIVAAERDWSECFEESEIELRATADIGVSSPNDMWTYMESLKNEAKGREVVPLDPATGAPVGFDPSNDEDYYENYGGAIENSDGTGFAFIGEQQPISERDLESLREHELEVWRADYDCQQQVDIDGVRVQAELQLVDALVAEFPDLDDSTD